MTRFSGKVVVVTGGNSGIGRAAALRFAVEGATVVIAARNEARSGAVLAEVEAAGGVAFARRCDVTVEADCVAVVEGCRAEFGKLDVLFNNAGIIYREKTAEATTIDEWDNTFSVNTRGTFLMSRAAIPAGPAY